MFVIPIVEIEIQQVLNLHIKETLSQKQFLETSALYLTMNEIKKQKCLEEIDNVINRNTHNKKLII